MVKYCTSCGTKLNDKDNFCINCGQKCEDSSVNESNKKTLFSGLDNYISDPGKNRAKIPHLNGISEIKEDVLIIRKTNEIIPFEKIKNFSLHQSSQTLWSDVKVDFDYNGLHYRTQQAGTDKGRLQTVENKIKVIEMNSYSEKFKTKNAEKDKINKLKDLKLLLDDGTIDEKEFDKLKDEIIKN